MRKIILTDETIEKIEKLVKELATFNHQDASIMMAHLFDECLRTEDYDKIKQSRADWHEAWHKMRIIAGNYAWHPLSAIKDKVFKARWDYTPTETTMEYYKTRQPAIEKEKPIEKKLLVEHTEMSNKIGHRCVLLGKCDGHCRGE